MRRRLALRRAVLAAVLAAAVALTCSYRDQWQLAFPYFAYLSGWVLFLLMLFLTAYNGRKKLPFIPLISSRIWLQVHIYAGLFTGFLFLLHIEWSWPSGVFETALALLFVP